MTPRATPFERDIQHMIDAGCPTCGGRGEVATAIGYDCEPCPTCFDGARPLDWNLAKALTEIGLIDPHADGLRPLRSIKR